MKILAFLAIGLVLAIIAAALVIPNQVRSRCNKPAACVNNLRQLDGAKEQWALEHKKNPGDDAPDEEVLLYVKGGKVVCPQGGVYRIGKVGEPPTCSVQGHTLN